RSRREAPDEGSLREISLTPTLSRKRERGNERAHAMSFSSIFIQRPIATSLLMVALLLLGLIGFRGLPVSALPDIDAPSLVVTTQYPGASASTMAALV